MVWLVAAAVLVAVGGVRLAAPGAGAKAAAAPRTADAPAAAAVVKQNAIPFSGLDVVLLGTGGALVLLFGAGIRRVCEERSGASRMNGDS
jgi:hypothetical protein